MKIIFGLALMIGLAVHCSYGQTDYYHYLDWGNISMGNFYTCGYKKVDSSLIQLSNRTVVNCASIYKQRFYGDPPYSIIDDKTIRNDHPATSSGFNPCAKAFATILKNSDSSIRASAYKCQFKGIAEMDTFKLEENICLSCLDTTVFTKPYDTWVKSYLSSPYEYVQNHTKEVVYLQPQNIRINNPTESNSYSMFLYSFMNLMASIQFKDNDQDPFTWPAAMFDRRQIWTNINMWHQPIGFEGYFSGITPNIPINPYTTFHSDGSTNYPPALPTNRPNKFWEPYAEMHIYRFNDYEDISSPEPGNHAAVRAQKGVPYHYYFSFTDAENDSVVLKPYQIMGSGRWFHPNIGVYDHAPLYFAPPSEIKSGFRDSVNPITYEPGFSYLNPIGVGSNFKIDTAGGGFSFTAPDTGVYLLAFKMEEYRDGKLLGDAVVSRLAYVLNGAYSLSKVYAPTALNNFSMSADTVYQICAGMAGGFTIPVGALGSNAQLSISDNHAQNLPGSNMSYQYFGSDSARLHFTWSAGTPGFYNLLVSAVDTNCVTNPNRITAFKNIRIQVKPPVGIHVGNTTICRGDSLTLKAANGTGPYQWSVVAGGDPSLPAITIGDSIRVAPSRTTKYVAYYPTVNCANRDTVEIAVVQDFDLTTLPDTTYCGTYQGGLPLKSQALAHQYQVAGTTYTYSWSPATGLDNPNLANPKIITPQATNTYVVTVSDNHGCFSKSDTVRVLHNPLEASLTPTARSICPGDTVRLVAGGGTQYQWTPVTGLSCGTCPSPLAAPQITTTYRVRITHAPSGCAWEKEAKITVNPAPAVDAGADIDASGGPFQLNGKVSGTANYYWTPEAPLSNPYILTPTGEVFQTTVFYLTAQASCTISDSMRVIYRPCAGLKMPNAFSPDGNSANDRFKQINPRGDYLVEEMKIYNRWGEEVYVESGEVIAGWDGRNQRNGAACDAGVYVYVLKVRCGQQKEAQQVTGNVTLLR